MKLEQVELEENVTTVITRVKVWGQINGIPAGIHGFHIHEYGDLTDTINGENTLSHLDIYNNNTHGCSKSPSHHTGDIDNIVSKQVGPNLVATYSKTFDYLQLIGEE